MILKDDFLKETCKAGQGPACCRFLVMGAGGFHCAKWTPFREVIEQRVAAGTFTAKGDNCEGVAY